MQRRFTAVFGLVLCVVGCEPSESDYIAEARRNFDSAGMKDTKIVKSTVLTTYGPPGKLSEVVLDFDGPRGKGECHFYYWNTGPRIQQDINKMSKCPAP